jgi:hypothetical protein
VSDHWHHGGPHHTIRYVFEPSMTGDGRVAVGLIHSYEVVPYVWVCVTTYHE